MSFFPERGMERPLDPPEARAENIQDVIPPTERSQDPERSMHSLLNDSARPLTDEERKAADRGNAAAGERVYAPASERVPKTVPDYGDVVTNMDAATPERQAAGQSATQAASQPSMQGSTQSSSQAGQWPRADETAFTRGAHPSDSGATIGSTSGPTDHSGYSDSSWNSESENRWMSNISGGGLLPFGMGWLGLSVCAGVGVWLWMRWRRERNKPINRLRRQARQAAAMARERMPDMPEMPDEATRPALGLGTALLSVAVLLWQQSQARSRSQADAARDRSHAMKGRAQKASKQASKQGRKAVEAVSAFDWMERLMQLREVWSANRADMGKVSMPKR